MFSSCAHNREWLGTVESELNCFYVVVCVCVCVCVCVVQENAALITENLELKDTLNR